MFGRIARRYDLANHLLSGGADFLWRRRAATIVAGWQPRDVLDLATGSGDLALTIQRRLPGARIVAADFSTEMLEVARGKGVANTVVADALQLPFDEIVRLRYRRLRFAQHGGVGRRIVSDGPGAAREGPSPRSRFFRAGRSAPAVLSFLFAPLSAAFRLSPDRPESGLRVPGRLDRKISQRGLRCWRCSKETVSQRPRRNRSRAALQQFIQRGNCRAFSMKRRSGWRPTRTPSKLTASATHSPRETPWPTHWPPGSDLASPRATASGR
jgi:Methylase involved in ubiquinone/menaquinone biosynthesis